nr:EAL domain-containing protein [Legionella yabuuchiae]
MGVEALMRWKNGSGFIPPAKFIPIIDNAIYTQKFHEWTLNAATLLANDKKLRMKNIYISLNVSPKVFLTDYFIPSIEHALSQWNGSSVRLAIEITESCILTDPLKAIDRLEILKDKGVSTLIDDFGTGYCSFAYLKVLPVTTLKIDKLFIDDLVKSKSAHAVVQCIISLTKNLGLSVISEGVETKAQLKTLINLGCDAGQGFLFYQPMDRDDLLKLLTKYQ